MRRIVIFGTLAYIALGAAATAASPPSSERPSGGETILARQVFDRLVGLEGEWQAASTRGWETVTRFEVAARGSVVKATTLFDEGRTMHTMYHMDGDRLMLTHYCEARNQPRLVATDFKDQGKTVTFTFLDATNLPSRDHGHMDKAIFRFLDNGRFSSRWTWYQEGKESWMEEIVYERLDDAGESG